MALESEVLDLKSISLGQFTKHLVARLIRESRPMPQAYDNSWHELFYKLHDAKGDKPQVISDMQFDWNGPSPISQDLSGLLNGIRIYFGVTGFGRDIEIREDDVNRWLKEGETFGPRLREYFDYCVSEAKKYLN
ncbi:hypothetical protein HY448_01875 [Candidatus Pacearchaeota archaeon]|nr:hypothetical protein [Candidatus Pacearchaeota archaeon]